MDAAGHGAVHALLMRSEVSELAILESLGKNVASGEGFEFVGVSVVSHPMLPTAGAVTPAGLERARVVVWARKP